MKGKHSLICDKPSHDNKIKHNKILLWGVFWVIPECGPALVLAGIELILFIIVWVCILDSYWKLLIIQVYFSSCWAVFTHSWSLFCFPHLPASRVEVHKNLAGGIAGTAGPSWSQEYSIPQISNKTGGKFGRGPLLRALVSWALGSWWWAIVFISVTGLCWTVFFSVVFWGFF